MNKPHLLLATLLLAACTTDFYPTGDNRLSQLQTHFIEATTTTATTITQAITDQGDTLHLTPTIKANWAKTPDSTYRALLYYRPLATPLAPSPTKTSATPLAIIPITTLTPLPKSSSTPNHPSDPVALQSAWVSTNRKYLNLGINIKTGPAPRPQQKHILGLTLDTIIRPTTNSTYIIRLFHHRNGMPAHYTSRLYLSIPLTRPHVGDTLLLIIPTSTGPLTRRFIL